GFDDLTNDNQVIAFPNPTSDKVTIRSNNPLSNVTIQIVSPQGTLINKKNLSDFQETTLDFSNYSEGIYFVKVQQQNGYSKTLKITVK
ncbi:MAG: Secretion system C-terminal sorting domain, partial [Bacteroidota bacterium]